jgi:hypothetical protein
MLYKTMVEFFLGKWADGFEKPYLGKSKASESGGGVVQRDGEGSGRIMLNLSENEADRFVRSQPLVYKDAETVDETVFNLRKMSELPYALVMSEQTDMAKTEVFCNLNWLYNKARALGLERYMVEFWQNQLYNAKDGHKSILKKNQDGNFFRKTPDFRVFHSGCSPFKFFF